MHPAGRCGRRSVSHVEHKVDACRDLLAVVERALEGEAEGVTVARLQRFVHLAVVEVHLFIIGRHDAVERRLVLNGCAVGLQHVAVLVEIEREAVLVGVVVAVEHGYLVHSHEAWLYVPLCRDRRL